MKRPLHPEEHRLWSQVAATIHPLPGRASAAAESAPSPGIHTSMHLYTRSILKTREPGVLV